jgi:hypothetical protein
VGRGPVVSSGWLFANVGALPIKQKADRACRRLLRRMRSMQRAGIKAPRMQARAEREIGKVAFEMWWDLSLLGVVPVKLESERPSREAG